MEKKTCSELSAREVRRTIVSLNVVRNHAHRFFRYVKGQRLRSLPVKVGWEDGRDGECGSPMIHVNHHIPTSVSTITPTSVLHSEPESEGFPSAHTCLRATDFVSTQQYRAMIQAICTAVAAQRVRASSTFWSRSGPWCLVRILARAAMTSSHFVRLCVVIATEQHSSTVGIGYLPHLLALVTLFERETLV